MDRLEAGLDDYGDKRDYQEDEYFRLAGQNGGDDLVSMVSEAGDMYEMEVLHPHAEDLDAEQLRREIEDHRATEKQRSEELDHQIKMWEEKKTDLQQKIEDAHDEMEHRRNLIDFIILKRDREEGKAAPGPLGFKFLEGDRCLMLTSSIILMNVIMLILELTNDAYEKEFFWFDQAFMTFYCFELLLKAIYYQKDLLIGDFSVVWWNWLDVVIVFSGVCDMWITPLLAEEEKSTGGEHQWINPKLLRILRLARLARIMKIVRLFMESDFEWTEGERFQGFIMGVIGVNAIIMGLECDFPDFWGWFYVEQALLFIFMFELLIRLKRQGMLFFIDFKHDYIWNWLDFIIVSGAVMDAYLLPLMSFLASLMGKDMGHSGNLGQIMMMLRMARLLRILRLIRLIKSIPKLYVLIQGIAQAMQGMVWVVVLTALLLYVVALLAVKLIGNGLIFPGGHVPPGVEPLFPDVLESMFVLFNIMNGQSPDGMNALLEACPAMKMVIMSWTMISSWAILSILTAVVSENMLQVTETHREEVEENLKTAQAYNSISLLSDIFEVADQTHNDQLSRKEFVDLINDPALNKGMIEASNGMSQSDLRKLFDYLSEVPDDADDDEPVVQRVQFIDGLLREKTPVSERSILRLEKRIYEMEKSLNNVEQFVCSSA